MAGGQVRGEPEWITAESAIQLHDDALRQFGGLGGFPHPGYLDGALGAPINAFLYDEDGGLDLFDLAAAYLIHIAKGHAFTDGNKRTAYLVALVFLDVNGVHLMQPENATELADAVVAAAEAEDLNKPDMAALMREMASRSPRHE